MVSSTAPYGTWSSPITAQAITKGANGIADVLVDVITSEVYRVENRPSEAGRNVLVHTKLNKDVVGEGWNVRTGVQEYGGLAAVIHAGVIYFSHLPDGRSNMRGAGKSDGLYQYSLFDIGPYTRLQCYSLHYVEFIFSSIAYQWKLSRLSESQWVLL
ncbi:uncharacterized protein LACBIDRAFT_303023 [Laccaria bicolor S238N-H82]|uniref:Predicted protein n=1 Tax=Laccaria bicolor (strain S238N-H82 / ATCC MYA-4686) TaxID=486041 RepID=B0DIS5_LACBS|nr:uncharacterized protein LACBIDRAFT_303023 [Laccaria bicolor S238N-H82]EDR05394.1 predicted protein [Laccaria bicolor S238N-H82]|eukprot:XP_001883952.1 predicted protein [Laccaria bicolor S238N-H82]